MNIYDILDRFDMYQTRAVMDRSKFCLIHAKNKDNISLLLWAKMMYLHILVGIPYEDMLLIANSEKSKQVIEKDFCELSSHEESLAYLKIRTMEECKGLTNTCFKIIMIEDASLIDNTQISSLKKIIYSDTLVFALTYNEEDNCIFVDSFSINDADLSNIYLYSRRKEFKIPPITNKQTQKIQKNLTEKESKQTVYHNRIIRSKTSKKPQGTLEKFRFEYGKDYFSNRQICFKINQSSFGRVKHPKYGIGIILDEFEKTYLVEFENYGKRELLKALTVVID